jgi:hypothetical protein
LKNGGKAKKSTYFQGLTVIFLYEKYFYFTVIYKGFTQLLHRNYTEFTQKKKRSAEALPFGLIAKTLLLTLV